MTTLGTWDPELVPVEWAVGDRSSWWDDVLVGATDEGATGTIDAQVPPAEATGVGRQVFVGEVSAVAQAATTAVLGSQVLAGAIDAQAPQAEASASGNQVFVGDVAATSPAATAGAMGAQVLSGTVAAQASQAEAAAIGNQVFVGGIEATSSAATAEALGAQVLSGTVLAQAPRAEATASGRQLMIGAVAAYAPRATALAIGVPTPRPPRGTIRIMNGNRDLSTPSVSTPTELSSVRATDYANGAMMYVVDTGSGVGAPYFLDKASTATPNGTTVVAPATNQGEGRWLQVVASSGPVTDQDIWYVNASAGSDANDGATALTPVATYAEVVRRFGGSFELSAGRAVTIYQIGDSSEDVTFTANVADGASLNIYGVRTSLVTGEVTDVQAYDGSVPQLGELEDTSIADWSLYYDRQIQFTSGTANGAIGWLSESANAAAGFVRFSPTIVPANNGTAVSPAIGDEYAIYALPEASGSWSIVTSAPNRARNNIAIHYLDGQTGTLQVSGGVRLVGCSNMNVSAVGPVVHMAPQWTTIAPFDTALSGTHADMLAMHVKDVDMVIPEGMSINVQSLSLFNGGAFRLSAGAFVSIEAGGLAFENEASPVAIGVSSNVQAMVSGTRIYGLNVTGTGLSLSGNASLVYRATLEPNFSGPPANYAQFVAEATRSRTLAQIIASNGYIDSVSLARMVAGA